MRKSLRIERLVIEVTDGIQRGDCRWRWFNHGLQKRHMTMFFLWIGRFWINLHMVSLYDRNVAKLRHDIVLRRLGINGDNHLRYT